MSVSAITRYGDAADFAPRGPEIDIVAPSDNVGVVCSGDFVTLDLRLAGCNDGPPDGHNSLYSRSFGGTSAAAPQVSAVAAMLLSRHPTLSREQVVSRLLTNAVYWGRSDDFGFGKLDAYRVLTGASLPPLPVGLDGTDIAHPLQQCTWSAAAAGGTEPYTYYWTVDGTAVGDGSETLRYTAGYADFVVRVQVNDASGRFGQASRSVRVDGSGQGCLEQ